MSTCTYCDKRKATTNSCLCEECGGVSNPLGYRVVVQSCVKCDGWRRIRTITTASGWVKCPRCSGTGKTSH